MTANIIDIETFEEGLSAFKEGKFSKSIHDLSKVIRLDPKKEIAYLTRGVAYIQTDKLDLALSDFEKAIELNPVNRRAFHLRGIDYLMKGENDKALRDFDRAIDLDSRYGAAYLSRARVLNEMGYTGEADDDMDMVVRLTKENMEIFSSENNIWSSNHLRLEAEGIIGEIER
jgi:tetratricopeptide (TPR) repeat protein